MKVPRKKGRWILFTLFLVVLAFFLSGSDGFINLYKLHLQDRKMEEEIEELNLRKDSLKIIIEKLKNQRKILVIANTYKQLPIHKRKNKEHLDIAGRLFFETNNTLFLTTLSLYNLWKKVQTGSVSVPEVFSLIKNQKGILQI